jgi:hypothetical protein
MVIFIVNYNELEEVRHPIRLVIAGAPTVTLQKEWRYSGGTRDYVKAKAVRV